MIDNRFELFLILSILGYPALQNMQSTFKKKLPDGLQSYKEEKYPEISMRTFFDFMRTAYQVNYSYDELSSVLNTNSQINWSALAKTNLDLITKESSSGILNTKINDKCIETEEFKNSQPGTSASLEKIRSSRSSKKIPQSSRSRVKELFFNIAINIITLIYI